MRVLVLGAGQVGTAIARTAAPARHEVLARSHAQLDIADTKSVETTIRANKIEWVVNAAAYTAVDRAEDEPELARSINDTAVAGLARAAERAEARLLHISTDYVFDGASCRPYQPGDQTHPLSVYGVTKRDGEAHVLHAGNGIVLRTSWVYASAGRNFVLTMLKLMREREQLKIVNDQIGTPTWALSVAGAVWGLIESGTLRRIYHWADLGVASWYDFAVAIQEEALLRGLLLRPAAIAPISTDAYPSRAVRPRFSVLDTSETRELLRIPGLHWREALRRMLDELAA